MGDDYRKEQRCIGKIDPEKCELCTGCDKDSPATWGEIVQLNERIDRLFEEFIELIAPDEDGSSIITVVPRE